jgi:hypothetical protein
MGAKDAAKKRGVLYRRRMGLSPMIADWKGDPFGARFLRPSSSNELSLRVRTRSWARRPCYGKGDATFFVFPSVPSVSSAVQPFSRLAAAAVWVSEIAKK